MTLRIFAAIAFVAYAMPAAAQDIVMPTTPSNFINYLLGVAVSFIGVIVLPLAYLKGRQLITEQKFKNQELEDKFRVTLDSGAQKAIGGALGRIDIPEGKLTGVTKDRIVNEAGAALAKNFPDAFAALGVEDTTRKAKEIVESRLGLMDAQAVGNPVPNPSAPIAVTAPSTQNVTVSPAGKR